MCRVIDVYYPPLPRRYVAAYDEAFGFHYQVCIIIFVCCYVCTFSYPQIAPQDPEVCILYTTFDVCLLVPTFSYLQIAPQDPEVCILYIQLLMFVYWSSPFLAPQDPEVCIYIYTTTYDVWLPFLIPSHHRPMNRFVLVTCLLAPTLFDH